jgi:leader peptidase (prepilin peptidase)/N-methyltransferase
MCCLTRSNVPGQQATQAERGNTVTLPWIIAAAASGVIAGPRIRASVFCRSTESGQPSRHACPACAGEILPGRGWWRSLLPVTGRCPSCRARIGPYPLLAELAAGLALAVVAARASSVWELAALAWLVLLAVPLAFIDVAVRRLPDPLTAAAFAGTLALLSVAALTGHQPGHLGRAAIGAVALAGFYLILAVIRPAGMGLGDAKLAASVGAALGWISWQALLSGTFAAFALAGVYGGALLAMHRATRTSHLPLGPFILLGTLAAIVL